MPSIICPRCKSKAIYSKDITIYIAIYVCQGCSVSIYRDKNSGKIERILPGPKTHQKE